MDDPYCSCKRRCRVGVQVVTLRSLSGLEAAFDDCEATRDWEDGTDRTPEW